MQNSEFQGQALNANVVVKEVQRTNETIGGIDISNITDKNEKYREGVIVTIGEHLPKDSEGNPYIKVGDTVVFDKNKASDFTQNGVSYIALYYSDLFLKK